MREGLKKWFGWRPGAAACAAAMAAVLLLLLIPLFRMAMYSVPWYDDYNYGRFAKTAMAEAPTFGNALKGTWECIRISWYAWQGTYGSILFMVLMPGIWGEEYYFIGPVFLILLLTVSVCIFTGTLLREYLKADWAHTVGISAGSAIVAVLLLHTAQEGFYWYNGGVHYVGMHSFALLLAALTARIIRKERRLACVLWMLLGMPLAFLVAGGNYITALQGLLVLLSMAALGIRQRRRGSFYLLPVLAVYCGGFYLNVTAPGNDKRAESYVGWGLSPVKAVLHSFVEGYRHAWEFTGWMTVLLLALMLPLIVHMVSRTSFRFRLPGVVSLWSVCLYAAGFTPSLYSLGHAGLGRTLNAVKLTWQLLLILNLVYWCGWIYRRLGKQGEARMCPWWWYPVLGILMSAVFLGEPNQAGSFTSYGAYYYVHTGEAYNFYQEYLERVRILNSEESCVVLAPYHWKPWLICMGDLSDDPEDESNRALADWYDKDEVICREPLPGDLSIEKGRVYE